MHALRQRRYEGITAERTARGMCPRCGKAKPVPDRTLCRPCGEKRRKAERARHAKARAAGLLYAGRDAECRVSDRSKRRNRARREAEREAICRAACEREQYGAACGRRVRQMRCARPRRQRALRTVRQERGQTLKEEGEERPRPPALRPAPGAKALHRLRRTVPGRGPVPGVRPPLVPALRRASRSADPAASLHGHRDRDRG